MRTNGSALVRETAGVGGGFANVQTTGASMREFMARMNGDAGIFLENGRVSDLLQNLAPIDVLTSLGIVATGDQPAPINCLVARFGVDHGIATPSTLLLDMGATIVTGAGNVDLDNETIDMKLHPYNKHLRLLSLHAPIDIGGNLAHPTFAVEAGGIVARLATAAALGVLFPPAALLPLIDTGLGDNNACAKAFAAAPRTPSVAATGSSAQR